MSQCDHSAMYLKDDEIRCALCDLEAVSAENAALRAEVEKWKTYAASLDRRARALLGEKT